MNTLTPRQLLDRLVSFPTVSRVSNLDLVDWLEGYLASHGIAAHRSWNEDHTKAALFAHVGPWVEGAVVLSGHSDVVPVDGQDWTSDPWTVTERDGRLYGRGTCDMKGFDALAVWALVEAQRRGVKRPMQLALSYDEEVGCTGAPPMIAAMQGVVPKAEAVVVGEPSRMALITGHKGGTGFHVHVKGFEVHSSLLPYGVSAIMEGARLIQWVNEENAAIQAPVPSAVAAMFDPPFTTLHVGMIEGGTAHNITAGDCRFAIEMRVVPDDDEAARVAAVEAEAARLDEALKARRPEAGVHLEKFFGVPALRPEADGAAEALVRRLTGNNATGVVSYGTEAGQFQAAGYSAVVCGPGDIAQAHQVDEFIEVSEFEAGHAFMERLLQHLG
ncbi:MAG: acetylornithine deacetylase [Tabrizicola sp.]|uniref:acetylornithine deacetylase n=1 Tax=Tabrizicola sp. TaxID=2005166 RepID=UPI0027373F8B|nr:acetylornithine deacetylase [Tabrizicola sp.]MDP3263347.1 acetylornithine deacetylase [Tabrizicola sp.]MDP3646704.1 acetylornithine deacetylase [Paracoccaceae bacterium]MDZ4067530.1 acetylornithine deacetylase [Tabrizicola sp.]